MKRHSLQLALLCGTLLASTLGVRPAAAQSIPIDPFFTQKAKCVAVLYSQASHTVIEITDSGVTGFIYCHTANIDVEGNLVSYTGTPTIISEAFNVCVGGKFHVGTFGTDRLNLQAASAAGKGNESLNRPFTQSGSSVTFLPQTGVSMQCFGMPASPPVPAYNLDSLPLGTMVSLITENLPVKGLPANRGGPFDTGQNADGTIPLISKCIGVRTTFQIMTGTCKLWKVRKFFNTCSSPQVLTQVKEFESIDASFTGGQAASATGGGLTAVALLNNSLSQLVSLTTGNTGANPVNANPKFYQPSAAGTVGRFTPDFVDELFTCSIVPGYPTQPNRFTSAQVGRSIFAWLQLFLSWFPGGVTLQPYGSTAGGFEKVVTYHLDVE